MNENTIFVRKYSSSDEIFSINKREIWRYSGYLGITENVDAGLNGVLDEVIDELKNSFAFKVCYRRMNITWKNGMPELPFSSVSRDLAKCLDGSTEIILFAATIGLEIDRHIAKHQRFSPTKALLMQAYGAERVESLCNAFCDEIKSSVAKENLSCTSRFSPGYGDLPLDTQIDMFKLLDCNRQIGISLNKSLLMTPSKSVTAIFGLGECVKKARKHGCSECNNVECEFRSDDNV